MFRCAFLTKFAHFITARKQHGLAQSNTAFPHFSPCFGHFLLPLSVHPTHSALGFTMLLFRCAVLLALCAIVFGDVGLKATSKLSNLVKNLNYFHKIFWFNSGITTVSVSHISRNLYINFFSEIINKYRK